jgi:hypothetical protein
MTNVVDLSKQRGPTAADPLRGLPNLGKVAILGARALQDLAKAQVHYVWTDIAIVGIIVAIAGGVGVGKTTLLFWILAARMNTGAPIRVLGRTVTPAPPGMFVVLVEGEHGEKSAARKIVKECRAAGIVDVDAALARIILIARKSVRIGSVEWGDIRTLIAAGLVSDLAIDTLARVAPADANDEAQQVAIYDLVAQAVDLAPSEDRKPVVWCVLHQRKDSGDDLESVSGSTQRTGQADTVLIAKAERRDGRVTSTKVIFAKLREEPDDYPAPVEFTVTKDSIIMADAVKADDPRPLEERILERLQLGPRGKSKLRDELGRNMQDLEEAISALFASRQIQSVIVKIRGRDCKAFALKSTPYSTPYSMGTPYVPVRGRTESQEDDNDAG